ncbi:MAG: tetratricopeptide repeat protein [Candidatus Omnitrophota bacterium]
MISLSKRVAWALLFCLPALLIINKNSFAFDKKASLALKHYIMAVMHESTGEIDKAIQEYKKALNADKESSVIHLNLASGYLKKNDIPSAIEELRASIKIDPDAIEPRAILALIYTSQNKPELARSEYEAALKNAAKIHPENVDIYKTLGILYIQGKKFPEAEEAYRTVVKLSPEDAEARFYLATIYNELKKNDSAEEELKRALTLKPDYHEALNFLGYLYVEENKNLAEAGELIRRALKFAPDNGAYIDSLGWFYFKKGEYKAALKELSRAISLVEDPVIYDHIGDTYFQIEDIPNARLNWEKSLTLNPAQDSVRKKIERLINERAAN